MISKSRGVLFMGLLLACMAVPNLPILSAPLQEIATAPLAQHFAAAEAQGKMIPVALVGAQALRIDGDLSDWGPLDPRAGSIFQGLDDVPGLESKKGRDATLFSLRADDQALCIAVRVFDASVRTQEPSYMGDCIQFFLDVRPTDGKGPLLNASAYSDGVYQLMITAPEPDDTKVHWIAGGQAVAPLGPFEIAARPLPDGYTLEMRIPFSSLKGMSLDRLKEPIGFDIAIDDIDAVGALGSTTTRAQYALSGSDDGWKDAAALRFAKIGYAGRFPAPFLRLLPAQYREEVSTRRIVGGLLTTREATPAQNRIEIRYRTPGAQKEPVPPVVQDNTTDYPQIGVRMTRHTIDLQSLNRGRYTVKTHFPGLPDADSVTAFDAVTWRRTASPSTHIANRAVVLPDQPLRNAAGTRLPNGWKLTPAGRALALPGDMPQRLLFTPDGRYLFVSTAGYHHHGIDVIDTVQEKVVQSLEVGKAWTGMALDSEHGQLFLSGGGLAPAISMNGAPPVYQNAVLRFAWRNGRLTPLPALTLPGEIGKNAYIAGLAVEKGGSLYVVDTQRDTVLRLGAPTFQVTATAHVGYRPNAIALSPSGRQIAVTNWGERSVSLLDAGTLTLQKRLVTGSHPFDLLYGPDGRLFVANAGANSVSVIQNGVVSETIKTSLDPKALLGSTPDALALTRDGKRLYIANADNNDVAVVDTAHPGDSRILGFLPTGWYPSALGVSRDGARLFIGTGKGLTFRANGTGDYIGTLLQGHVSIVARPDGPRLAAYTRQVVSNTPLPDGTGTQQQSKATAIASAPFRKIKHVLYIIRENRTYDQVFGDLARGNGDPSLTLFGRDVTPNAHALAQNYVLLDNLYCNGEVSEDGHEWCNAAYATDFTQRAWPVNYSDRGEPDADERLTASPAGYLWDNCARHGLSYYSYGEFVSFKSSPKSPPVYAGPKALGGHASLAWSQFSYDRHDTEKTGVFLADLRRAEKTGVWPRYQVMSLGEDHTQGTTAGKYTPMAHVAANDQALGQIVEAVSHSRFWLETAIFVIEDDAQSGPDHVDAHRTLGLVISPYVRRGIVDSTFYTTASFVRTMELMLGLPPMTQYDAAATPLTAAFMRKPDLTPYRNLSPRVDLEARNGAMGPGVAASAKLDFSAYDRVKPEVLNHILWEALKPGIPYPGPVRSALAAFRGR
ncbi:MAG: beta-propeller repeat-containing protein [Chthonomonadaceae bacterium]|nr:beta-propeller repeat-containing protein [Chthonomonadaceae bacterium]